MKLNCGTIRVVGSPADPDINGEHLLIETEDGDKLLFTVDDAKVAEALSSYSDIIHEKLRE